jgi:predicted HTH transcriptional regulator
MSISVPGEERVESSRPVPEFSFLTNHGKTLLLIAHDPRIRMRDIASLLDITERRTQRIVADLAEAGYINREREGRRNLYSVSTHLPLGLPTQRDTDIGALLAVLPPTSNGST